MTEENPKHEPSNVIDFFSGRPIDELTNRIIRISPEFDGLEMLYSNDTAPDKLYSLKIVCWAMREDGEIFGMVPWLNDIVPCTEIDDPLNGRWEGYRDPRREEIFYLPPQHKVIELESAFDYYTFDEDSTNNQNAIVQEIPDVIGTHAVLTDNGFRTFSLVEVYSWQLLNDGRLHGTLVNEEAITQTPVLPGDTCLFSAQEHTHFRYFFQHRIANKIKEQDPEALAAIAMLIER
ncbi:MAG: hypothetical protein P8176_16155 [Gammaproteobacteria bacterium]